jgi:hypothetical protein
MAEVEGGIGQLYFSNFFRNCFTFGYFKPSKTSLALFPSGNLSFPFAPKLLKKL